MTRTRRLIITAAFAVLGIALVTAVSGILIFRSDWFREKVRQRIISEAEKATNGRVEAGAFRFDWNTLTAELDDLTIHGTEPAGAEPLLAVKRLVIGLKIISLMERSFDLARIDVVSPRAHLIIRADGGNNIPPPQKFKPQTVLDLKVRRFDLKDGFILLESADGQKKVIPWKARAENLAAQAKYDAANERYDGDLTLAPLHLEYDGLGAVEARVTTRLALEKNLLTLSSASIKTAVSELQLNEIKLQGFNAPVVTGDYHARVALDEADRVFKLTNFQHLGTLDVAGRLRFVSPSDYTVLGAAYGFGLAYGTLRNLSATTNFIATPDKVQLTGMLMKALDGTLAADGEVIALDRFHLKGTVEHLRSNGVVAVAGFAPLPWDGMLSGPFDATGTLSERDFHSLIIKASASVSPTAEGTPVRGSIEALFDSKAATVNFGPSSLVLPQSRADFSGTPSQRVKLKIETRNLNELRAAIPFPAALRDGAVSFEGTVSGPFSDPVLEGHLTATNLDLDKQRIDSLTGEFDATGALLRVRNTSVAWGALQGTVNGSLGLNHWKAGDNSAVTADLQIANGDIAKLLALSGTAASTPFTGTVGANAQVTGTLGDPHATADITIAKGDIYGEPYDLGTAHAEYLNSGAQALNGSIAAGTKRVGVAARFDHAAGPALAGKLTYTLTSNAIPLNQVELLRKREPDIHGTAVVKAEGSVDIAGGRATVLDLNSDVTVTALAVGIRSFGDAHLTTTSRNGLLTARFDSNAIKATIHGEGTMKLSGDYPLNAKVTFSSVKLNAIEAALNPQTLQKDEPFDGDIAGDMMLSGPAAKPELLTAAFNISQLEVRPAPAPGQSPAVQALILRNNGPLRFSLAGSVVRVESARLQGPETNLEVSGTISLNQQAPLDLRVTGNIGLALAHTLNEDLTSAGTLALNATVRGSLDRPDLSGRGELSRGDFHYTDFANGLTNARGSFLFNGNRATIQSFTAETGGGKVSVAGFGTLSAGVLGFRVEAKAREVRIRYPEGVSSLSDADITLTGTSERSQASGTVTIRRISINPKSDAGSILAQSVEPARTSASRTGLAANLNLDIQIETAPDVAFETSVAQSVQADASLRLRGTATNPALLGRVNVTQGEMVVFGNKYTINQGSVSFFNPAKIDPVINVDLETKSRGVDVILTITGPIAKLNVSYRSDPPLQFGDIVALLATGRTPVNTTVAANTGGSQAFQQLGASALIGQAIAAPAPGRLQRFFGVSKIKIDPQLTGVTGTPEARLTWEQQVTPNILFTYVSNVTNTSTQLYRVEWTLGRAWGAILTREENGYVGLDFAYKKRFK